MKKHITAPSNAAFPIAIMAFAGIFLIFGLVIMGQNLFIGIGMAVLSLLVLSSRVGYQIDVKKKTFRNFSTYFGFRNGTWVDISKYEQVSLLSTRMNSTAYSRSNRATSDHSAFFRVCLLDDTHLRKLVVYESGSRLRAEAFLEDVVNNMPIKQVRYSPKPLKQRQRR